MTPLKFDLEWRTTVLTVVLAPILIALGFWQLERADEKRAIAAKNEVRAAAPAQALASVADRSPQGLAFRRVRLEGRFLPEPVIFLDNQIRDGRYGHDVLNLFLDEAAGEVVLLNRGWIPGDPSRRSLPDVSTPTETLTLQAAIYVPPGDPYTLAPETFASVAPRMLVQQANSPALRTVLESASGRPLFPRELRLEPGEEGGFRRDWPVVNVSPRKHQGYALQWFTMAAVLLLFFVLRSTNLTTVLGLRRRGAQ